MATPPSTAQPKQGLPDRPTRELILLALWDDEQKGNRRTQRQLCTHVGVVPSTVNGHLKTMALEQPALLTKQRHGRWGLTEFGRDEARGLTPKPPPRPETSTSANVSGPPVAILGEIPLLGVIAAGEPVLMEEVRLLLDALVQGKLPDWTSTALHPFAFPGVDAQHQFAMIVRGESMLQAHICDGDVAIFRYATGWDGWDKIQTGDILAAAVPEGASIENAAWLNQVLAEDFAGDTSLSYITLKQYDALTKELVGRGGRIRTLFRPIGILEHIVRTYQLPSRDPSRIPLPLSRANKTE